MAIEVLLAQFGMGMQDGKIVQWYVAEGDTVTEGQPICEVEAAKAVFDVEAPASGVLARIVVKAEETAEVRDLIAVIDDGTGGVEAFAPVPDRPQGSLAPFPQVERAPVAGAGAQVEPRARRLAGELGVNLPEIQGTGPGGRITTADVERAAKNGE